MTPSEVRVCGSNCSARGRKIWNILGSIIVPIIFYPLITFSMIQWNDFLLSIDISTIGRTTLSLMLVCVFSCSLSSFYYCSLASV